MKRASPAIEYIEYSNPEYSEYSAVALDSKRNVVCWIISEYNQDSGKMKYIAVNNRGKAIFPPGENLINVKKQIRLFNREKRVQELQELREEKSHREQELSR